MICLTGNNLIFLYFYIDIHHLDYITKIGKNFFRVIFRRFRVIFRQKKSKQRNDLPICSLVLYVKKHYIRFVNSVFAGGSHNSVVFFDDFGYIFKSDSVICRVCFVGQRQPVFKFRLLVRSVF